ncbi:MAG: hypothetical protein U5R30_20115 [Deltaproteobacteria bacterium]|nr:hypothetical protein [Deltaproteobacteria bacterium]
MNVTAELVEAMARAGCAEVSLGFESGNRRVLAGMRKRFDPEDVRHAARLLGAAGIRRMGFLLCERATCHLTRFQSFQFCRDNRLTLKH